MNQALSDVKVLDLTHHIAGPYCTKLLADYGAVSRIVPQLDQGAIVTIPRYFADYVITEYGIARLMGKDCRQRAEELIAIAHPDFRGDLRQEAKKLFYP